MDIIISADEEAIVSLYGGNVCEGLDKLRYRRFLEKPQTYHLCKCIHYYTQLQQLLNITAPSSVTFISK